MAEGIKNKIWEKLSESNHKLLTAFCEFPHFSNASLATALLELLDEKALAQDFTLNLLSRRIQSASMTESKDFTNVMRDNLFVVSAVIACSNNAEGQSFLKKISASFKGAVPLLEVLEMNPNNLPEGEDLQKRANNIVKAVDIILNSAYSSVSSIPPYFAKVSKLLRAESEKRLRSQGLSEEKSKEGALRLVGGYYFLRLFIPLVTVPSSYSLIDMSKEQRKGSILLAKVLSTLVSQMQFGVKDEHLIPLNEKLANHREKIVLFLDQISQPGFQAEKGSSYPPKPSGKHFENIDHLLTNITKNLPKLEETISEEPIKVSISELKVLLAELQAPADPREIPAPSSKEREKEKEKEKERPSKSSAIVLPVFVAVAAAAIYYYLKEPAKVH